MSELAVRAAAVTVLAAGDAVPKTLQDLKTKDPERLYYNEITVSDRYGDGQLRLGVWLGTGGYRITTRAVGATEDAAYQMRELARTALEYAVLTIGDVTTTPVMFETAEQIAEDDGWWSGLTTWTTTL